MKKRWYVFVSKQLNDDMVEVFCGFWKDYCFPWFKCLLWGMWGNCQCSCGVFNAYELLQQTSVWQFQEMVYSEHVQFSWCLIFVVIMFYAIKLLMKNYFWYKAWSAYSYDLMWEMSTWDIPLATQVARVVFFHSRYLTVFCILNM